MIAIVFAQFTLTGRSGRGCLPASGAPFGPVVCCCSKAIRPSSSRTAAVGPRELEQLYTRELLEREFAGFAALEIREYDADLNEGSRHAGRSALIDLVATQITRRRRRAWALRRRSARESDLRASSPIISAKTASYFVKEPVRGERPKAVRRIRLTASFSSLARRR